MIERIRQNKKITIAICIVGITLISIVLYFAFRCRHEWKEATCTEPKTCVLCDKTEGEFLGHTWTDATCTEPNICSVCGETDGEPLGHTWTDATCTEPNICSICGEIDGEPLGHTWADATCTEPKTCSVCGQTEGEPLGHTWIYATCIAPETCNICGITEGETAEHAWISATCMSPQKCNVCGITEGGVSENHSLNNYGSCTICGKQIGFKLNTSNFRDYVKISTRDTRNKKSRIVQIQPIKNVSFNNVSVKMRIAIGYFDDAVTIRLDSVGYGEYEAMWSNDSYQYGLYNLGYELYEVAGYVIE